MNKTEATKLLNMVNGGQIEELKSLLENTLTELKMKELRGNGYLKAAKRVQKELERIGKMRPILGYYDIQGEKQVFTDSYFAFKMNQGHYLENLEYHGNNNGVYPSMDGIFPEAHHGCLQEISFEQLANPQIIPMCGKDVPIYNIESERGKIAIQAKYLENAIQILGNDDLKMYVYGTLRPVLLTSPKGESVILPIRTN